MAAPSSSVIREIHGIRCRRRLVEYLTEQLPREDNNDCEDINFAHYNETIQSPSLIWSLNSQSVCLSFCVCKIHQQCYILRLPQAFAMAHANAQENLLFHFVGIRWTGCCQVRHRDTLVYILAFRLLTPRQILHPLPSPSIRLA